MGEAEECLEYKTQASHLGGRAGANQGGGTSTMGKMEEGDEDIDSS
jgi:hypothetical protein